MNLRVGFEASILFFFFFFFFEMMECQWHVHAQIQLFLQDISAIELLTEAVAQLAWAHVPALRNWAAAAPPRELISLTPCPTPQRMTAYMARSANAMCR